MVMTSGTPDKFEQAMSDMATLSETEMKMHELEQMCICRLCPTYNFCVKEKGELLFWAKGKTGCIGVPKGCDLSGCPVKDDLGLKHKFYCIKGTEREQRKK